MTSFAVAIEKDCLEVKIVAAKSEVKSLAAFFGLVED
jgi:hypothetical protein